METLAVERLKLSGRRPDARRKAVLITVAGVFGLGALIALAPRQWVPDDWQDVWKDASRFNYRVFGLERHVRNQRAAEVRQRFDQGVAMLQRKEYEYALACFHRVIELQPRMAEAHVNAGFAMLGLGKYGAAYDFFVGATELNPGLMNGYYGMAVALEALGDLEVAVGAMRTYVHLAPQSDPYRRLGMAALWEWETKLKVQRGLIPPPPESPQPEAGGK